MNEPMRRGGRAYDTTAQARAGLGDDPMLAVREAIRGALTRRGMTQADLGRALGIDQHVVSRLLVHGYGSLATLIRMLDYLDLVLDAMQARER